MSLPHHLKSAGGIPAIMSLADKKIWLPWRNVPRANGKTGKPPVVPATGKGDGWNEPSAWVTYAESIAYAEANDLTGVGIVFGPHLEDIVGIDLDNSIDGKAVDWARAIIRPDGTNIESYTEISPSGKGIRALCRGKGSDVGNGVELYDGSSLRFLTITGRIVKGSPRTIEAAPATLAAARARIGVPAPEKTNQGGDLRKAAPGATSLRPKGVTTDTLRSALEQVPVAELGYDEWLKVGQALHHHGGGDDALAVWDEWSARDDGRYDTESCAGKWTGFGKTNSGNQVTARYVLKLAGDRGWKQPATKADFGAVEDDDFGPLLALDEADKMPLPDWPEDVLPEALASFACNVAVRCGGDPNVAKALVLPLVGSCAPRTLSFRPRAAPDWRAPPTYFVGVVGSPGSVKTPVITGLTQPITTADARYEREDKAAMARHRRRLDTAKKEKTNAPDEQPRPKRRTTSNATPEGFAKMVERSDEAGTILTDELQSFFGGIDKYNGGGSGGSSDRSFWLSAYEGKSYRSDRADDARSLSVEGLRASIFGGIQPKVLGPALSLLSTDGLAQRFLWLPVRARLPLSSDTPPDAEGAARYERVIGLVLALRNMHLGLTIDLKASVEAKAVSYTAEQFGIYLRDALAADNPLREVAAKSRGFVARLTFALHLIEWAYEQADVMMLGLRDEPDGLPLEVSVETAQRAHEAWRQYYWPAIVTVHRQVAATAINDDLQDLIGFLRTLPRGATFTARDAGQHVRRWRKDPSAFERVIQTLEAKNYVRKTAGRQGDKWMVNPAVRTRGQPGG